MNFSGIFHNKLFLFGGGFIALLVLFRLLSGNHNGVVSTANVAAGPTDAQVQSQTTLALAQIDSASKANETNASFAAAQLQYQEELAAKGIDASLARYSIDASVATQSQQISAQSASDARNADLQASIAKWTLDQASAMQANNNAFQLSYAANANASADHQAEIVAAVTNASIQAQTTLGVATLQSEAAQVASYTGSQVAINESNNAKDVSVAQVTASANHKSPFWSAVGGLASIFSDRRLKVDIARIGTERRDGLDRYSYRLAGDRSYQVGVMADEVPARAKGRKVAGWDTVNYGWLAA